MSVSLLSWQHRAGHLESFHTSVDVAMNQIAFKYVLFSEMQLYEATATLLLVCTSLWVHYFIIYYSGLGRAGLMYLSAGTQ